MFWTGLTVCAICSVAAAAAAALLRFGLVVHGTSRTEQDQRDLLSRGPIEEGGQATANLSMRTAS